MFEDRVKIQIAAGKGGNGIVSWRRAKYIPKGGPWGGNGGRGGNVILRVDPNEFSLEHLRHTRILKAEHGRDGGPNLQQGGQGSDLVIKVPPGTLVLDQESREVLQDLTEVGQQWVVCQGGRGGRGNASFRTSTNRAPHYCTLGSPGETKDVELELKLIADVGLVGWPNAGKSTLISSLTSTIVKIAPYPFTTLRPNLGFIEFEDYSKILLADIPGIIKGAHEDRGLGLEFLRHIERTKVLVYLIDMAGSDGRDPIEDFRVLLDEVGHYSESILSKPSLVLLNKMDLVENPEELQESFSKAFPDWRDSLLPISCLNGDGFKEFVGSLKGIVHIEKTDL